MHEFESKKAGLFEEYLDFLQWVYKGDKFDYITYNRIYLRDVRWTVNGFFKGDVDPSWWGYSKSKMTLLQNNYEDHSLMAESKRRLDEQLEKKKTYISTAFSFITGRKVKRLKSYCMTSAVYIQDKVESSLDIYYRVTEVTKKFGGDLCFLRQVFEKWIPPVLLEDIDRVTFHFTLMYVVPIYYPLAHIFGIKVPKKSDKWFHKECWRQIARAEDPEVKPKFAQTERVYRTYREWKESGHAYFTGRVLHGGSQGGGKTGNMRQRKSGSDNSKG